MSARFGGAPPPAAAASTASLRAPAAQPLFELAFNPEDIKARLNAVPVFAVVNNKNEFVLVAGDVSAPLPSFFVSLALLPLVSQAASAAAVALQPDGMHAGMRAGDGAPC